MTHERDIERLLDNWFADGPTMPLTASSTWSPTASAGSHSDPSGASVLEAVSEMNTTFKLGAAVAAVPSSPSLAATCCPGSSTGTGGPGARRRPRSPSASPSASPSDGAVTERIRRDRIRQRPGLPVSVPRPGSVTSTAFTPTVSYTAPAGYVEVSDVAQAYGVGTVPG